MFALAAIILLNLIAFALDYTPYRRTKRLLWALAILGMLAGLGVMIQDFMSGMDGAFAQD